MACGKVAGLGRVAKQIEKLHRTTRLDGRLRHDEFPTVLDDPTEAKIPLGRLQIDGGMEENFAENRVAFSEGRMV